MLTYNELVDNLYQRQLLESSNGAPVRRLTTAWLLGDRGLFRVDVSIIRPKTQESHNYFTLRNGEAKRAFEALINSIKALEEELG